MDKKIIVLDWGIFLHRSIFSWRNNKQMPPEYTCLNMIIASLRRIGIAPYDKIIVACDGRHSWRKDVDKEYKANRKAFRDSFEDIDWGEMYTRFDELLEKLDRGTDWQIVKGEGLEADDWMAVACRYFKDNEVVLVSYDGDMEQLCIYPNVKIFSPLIKMKGGKGGYKVIKNPYKILAKKIEKEQADNLVNPILNEEDYKKREMIVSLIELPDYIENQIIEQFDNLKAKENYDLSNVPYDNIRNKLANLYNDKDKIVSYEECVLKAEKKKSKKKVKRKK